MIHTSLAAKKRKEFYFPNTKPSTQSQTNRQITIYSYIAIHLAIVAISIKEFLYMIVTVLLRFLLCTVSTL